MPKPSYTELKATNEELVANNEELKATSEELVATNKALNSRFKKEMQPESSKLLKDISFNCGMWIKNGNAYETIEEAVNG